MPWRTIDAAATASAAASGASIEPAPTNRPSNGTLAVLGVAGLVAIAAFALAFGSGAAGSVGLAGGAQLSAIAGIGSDAAGDNGSGASEPVVVVEIVGAVVKPGVYRLPRGSRVGDLVTAAGGFGPRVDTVRAADALNRAAVLDDGAQIRVPSRDDPETATTGGSASTTGGPGGPLDLNTATNAELEALPGIGPVTAAKIITSREETRFSSVDDLRTRKLLGEKTFAGLKDLVAVR
jgi:competence protein ComEA